MTYEQCLEKSIKKMLFLFVVGHATKRIGDYFGTCGNHPFNNLTTANILAGFAFLIVSDSLIRYYFRNKKS